MRKSEKVFLSIGSVSFFIMLINIILEFFSVSIFLAGKKMISFIGIFVIVTAVCFTVFTFLVFKNHKSRFGNKKVTLALKILISVFCIIACFSGLAADGFLYTDIIHKEVAPDKRHTLIVEKEPGTDEWNATVYRRYNSFIMSERDSETLIDMADSDEDISVEWADDCCKMSYLVFGTNADSEDDTETIIQKFFYSNNK